MLKLMVLSLALFAAGCGGDDSSTSNAAPGASQQSPITASYEYEIVTRNSSGYQCTTGRHVLYNFQDYCNALVNEQLNQGCGYYQRRDKAKNQNCPNVYAGY